MWQIAHLYTTVFLGYSDHGGFRNCMESVGIKWNGELPIRKVEYFTLDAVIKNKS